MKNEVVRTPVLPGVVLALVCLSGTLVACHDDDKVSGSSDSADADADTAEDADLVDTTEPDVSDATDAVETDGTSCTEPGGTFCPCTDNASCNSGVCVPTSAGGNVCSRTCDEVCPSGWECKPIALSGTDPTFICVERALELCRPCRQQSDCLYPGFSEPGDRCVEVDALSGAFCGNACSADEDCPDTFACREVKSLGSAERTFQCVPENGECACSGRAVELAADTACQRGACSGRRVCEVAGLTTCSASEPGLEICDGLDNDCSGQTDEGFVDTDRDQKADCVDTDDDGDNVDDATDVCPLIADPDQGDGDGDDLGDACDPPAMPVLRATSPESPANGVAVQVLGEGERGAIVTLFDDANCTNARGEFAVVDGTFAIAVTVPRTSTTPFWGRATNGAGLTSACSNTSVAYVEDSSAPAVPIFVGTTPSSPSQTILNPIVTGIAEALSTVRLYTSPGCDDEPIAETETGTQGVFLASVTVAEGTTTTFFATATDAAGNVSACTPQGISYTHLRGAVETYLTSGPSNPSTSTSATFWFIANVEGATFSCRFDALSGAGAFAPCTSPLTYENLGSGPHRFEAYATNRDGVSDPTPARFDWVIDTTPPQTQITAKPPDPSNDATPTFGFTVNEPNSTAVCRIDSEPFVLCTSPWTTPALGDGAHTIYILATDAAGNQEPVAASYSWRIDTDAPETQLTPLLVANPSAVASASFTLGSDEVGTFTCTVDGVARVCPSSGSTWTVQGLGDGSHTVAVAAIDRAGNVDPTPATFTWVVDTTAPETFFVGALPQASSNETSVTFRFGSNDGTATFECQLGSPLWSSCTSPFVANLGSGAWTMSVRAVDTAGNRDPTPAVHNFTVDATAPDTVITARPPSLDNRTQATFSFTSPALDVALFRCWLDGVGPTTCTSPYNVLPLAEGQHTFEVAAVDTVGNEDPTPATWTWTVDSVPPDAPTGLVAVGGNRKVSLTWNGVPDAVKYRVSYGAGNLSQTVDVVARETVIQPLPNCTTYTFEVRAIDLAGNVGAPSGQATATTVLPAPGYDVVGGHGLVNVRWDDVDNADTYRVYYGGTAGGPYTGSGSSSGASPIAVPRNANRTFAVRGLPADTKAYVIVSAMDGTCESARGAEWATKPYPFAWVSPTPTGNSLRGLACSGATCVAVGNVGTALRSVDSGATWVRGNGGTGEDFVDVAMVDANVVVALAGQTIHRSTNGGVSFEPVLAIDKVLSKVRFAGQTGWAVAAGGKIYRSVDSGQSWATQDSTTTGDLYAVWAVSASEAWAAGAAGKILRTTDGGTIWSSVDGPSIRALRDLVCNGTRCLAVGEQGTILEYASGTWASKVSGTPQTLSRVVFVGGLGVVVGSQRTVVTEAAGGAWSATTKDLGLGSTQTGAWFALATRAAGGAWVAGEAGSLGRISGSGGADEGAVTTYLTKADLRGLSGKGDVSVAVGAQTILRSGDGATWTAVAGAGARNLNDVVFANATVVFAVGSSGAILKSTDAGQTFGDLTSGQNFELRGVTCLDANLCWAGGAGEVMLKTSNGGTSWGTKLGVYGTNAVSFADPLNGVLVIDNQYVGNQYTGVLYSIDGGDTWTSYQNYSTGRGVAMASGTSGYYVGNSGSNYCQEKAGLSSGGGGVAATIFQLVPNGAGGVRWETALSAGIDFAGDCFFGVVPRSGGKVIAAGTQGLFGRDLGERGWVQLPPPTRERDLFDLRESSPGKIVAVGERGTILTSETGGL